MIRTITVFAAGASVDLFYVAWVRAIGSDSLVLAAVASMLIGAASLLGVANVVKNGWMAVPYLVGLGCGTAAGMLL
jgi:hypothetical protein